ncbi:MAG: ABC transporter ATP-binding protein [Caldilineaceae bacterium]|nr:ABC transporter ATP-binding protein [Caldilineaceae bacterium]
MSSPSDLPLLRVEKVSHAYSPETPVLAPVSFDVADGEFVCIVGTSGSGKSTLLRIIGGLVEAKAGAVWLAGALSTEPHPEIGFVFQKTNLMPWRTALENVLLPLELLGPITPTHRSQAMALLELVGLADSAHSFPAQLSGGMAQRLVLARALVRHPRLLLLDEPFGALDALTRERLNLELLRIQTSQQQTVVMVTHSINEAVFLGDRVLVLGEQPGRILAEIHVDLPRPRNLALMGSEKFGALATEIRRHIGLVEG